MDLFTHLIDDVGDADALWRLDAIPLPDEPFDWSGVEPRDVAFGEQVLALSDRCCVEILGIEFRTDPPSWPERLPLGDPALLHSGVRAGLVMQRDLMLEVAGRRCTWSLAETDGSPDDLKRRRRRRPDHSTAPAGI